MRVFCFLTFLSDHESGGSGRVYVVCIVISKFKLEKHNFLYKGGGSDAIHQVFYEII